MSTPQILNLLGRIDGTLDRLEKAVDRQGETLTGLDERLRGVEERTAIQGATAGGLTALAVAAMVSMIKARLGVDLG